MWAYARGIQVDDLERDALEVLRLVRSIKNSFAPINRIPPEVLSLIPDYCGGGNADEDLIALTHVCRDWRDIFISRPSLWTELDFRNMDKARTYLQRSRSSPLDLYLDSCEVTDDEFALVTPHTHRLKYFTLNTNTLPRVLTRLRCQAPLLEELNIDIGHENMEALDDALFNGDFSSLRKLRLCGIVVPFAWKNLENLRFLALETITQTYGTAQILDFLEPIPLLESIRLRFLMLDLRDLPPKRIVPLRHLKGFSIGTRRGHSGFLHHLQIPPGAKLVSDFCFDGDESPLPGYLPQSSPVLSNLSDATTINLRFTGNRKSIRLSGPSGSLRVHVYWKDSPFYARDHQILRSLSYPMLSTIERLIFSDYKYPTPGRMEECPIFHTFSSASNLRTLTLINGNKQPFILALDPEKKPYNPTVCPNMEDLIIYSAKWPLSDLKLLAQMAKNRALRGAKLSSITIVDLGRNKQRREMVRLRRHAMRVEYRMENEEPNWDYVPGQDE